MSNALQTASLLEGIRGAVVAAWPGVGISFGAPRVALGAPYAVVLAESVSVSFDGLAATVLGTSQENRFSIVGRFPFPSDPSQTIALQKVVYANELIAELQAGASFASIGMLPIVTMVDYSDLGDPNERVFCVTLGFSVVTQATHH